MAKSIYFSVWIECFTHLQHGPKQVGAAACEGDEGLGVVFSLFPLAVVEGFGQRVLWGYGAECALIEGPFECLVTAIGLPPARTIPRLALNRRQSSGRYKRIRLREASDISDCGQELCRQNHTHPRQRTDEGAIRLVAEDVYEVFFDTGDLLSGRQGFCCELADQLSCSRVSGNVDALRLGAVLSTQRQSVVATQVPGLLQIGHDPRLSFGSDLCQGHIAGEQCQRYFGTKVKRLFKTRMNAAQEPTDAGDPADLVLHQDAPAPHFEAQRDACANEFRDGTCIPGIRLAFASRKALYCPVYDNAWNVEQRKPFGQKAGFNEARKRADHIDPDHSVAFQDPQFRYARISRRRGILDRAAENNHASIVNTNGPMNDLGRVNSNTDHHLLTSSVPAPRISRRGCIALQGHREHRVISCQSGAAQRPEPSRTARMTTMPSLPAYQQLRTIDSAKKRGKAA